MSIKDGTPEVGEISAAVTKIRSVRAVRLSDMKAGYLREWLRSATREKYPDTKTWDKVVSVIHIAFWEGYIPEALMWKTMVLIPKGKWGYIGIGLVETIWKVCTSIENSLLRSSIVLHSVLHGFIEGRGAGTEIMEAKLEQQLAGIIHETFFQVFLDVRKAYFSLDRGRCMEILLEYGLGSRLQRLLLRYWDGQRVVTK